MEHPIVDPEHEEKMSNHLEDIGEQNQAQEMPSVVVIPSEYPN